MAIRHTHSWVLDQTELGQRTGSSQRIWNSYSVKNRRFLLADISQFETCLITLEWNGRYYEAEAFPLNPL